MQLAALVAGILIGVVVVFQVALAAGAPMGAAAWGGRHRGTLPVPLRRGSAVAAVLLVLMAWIVLAAGHVIAVSPLPESWLSTATWVVAGYFMLGTLMNAASRSPIERLWAPVALAVAICVVLVAKAS